MKFRQLLILTCFFWLSCNREGQVQEPPPQDKNCEMYIRYGKKLENLLLEADRNANRLENVMYMLTGNYLLVDEKIRLVEKIRNQPGKEKLLQRTASEILLIFKNSRAMLDSAEHSIRISKIPQSSLLPVIDNIRRYLYAQENLFIEVNGSLQNISKQVGELRKEVSRQKDKKNPKPRRNPSDPRWSDETEEESYPRKKIYYLVGSRDELARAKVVQRKGGFLGLGSTLQLSDKLEDMYFQSADFMIMKEIALGNTEKVNIITTHPKNAYLIINTPGEKFLKVTNPEKFWSASNYLVIEVD
jgi:hypothetical protein